MTTEDGGYEVWTSKVRIRFSSCAVETISVQEFFGRKWEVNFQKDIASNGYQCLMSPQFCPRRKVIAQNSESKALFTRNVASISMSTSTLPLCLW